MELDALDRVLAVAEAHDRAVVGRSAVISRQSGSDDALDDERVVADGDERAAAGRRRRPGRRGGSRLVLPCISIGRVDDRPAVGVADALVPEADAEQSGSSGRTADDRRPTAPASLGAAGPGRDDDPLGRELVDLG